MPLLTNFVEPLELVQTSRRVFEATNTADMALHPIMSTLVDDATVVEWTSGENTRIQAATFRAYDAESRIGGTEGGQKKSLELPPISRKNQISEYDQLRFRQDKDTQIRDRVLKSAGVLAAGVAGRLELARSEALYTGKLVLNEDGVVFNVDYGRANTHNASAAVSWGTSSTATPITDLLAGDALIADAGGSTTDILMNRVTYQKMVKANEVKNMLTVGGATPALVSNDMMSSVLAAFGLPPITIYDKAIDVAGSKTKVITDNKVILVDRVGAGVTKLGRTLLQDQVTEVSQEAPGIMAHEWLESPDPVALWVKAEAYGLPILEEPDFSVGLDVS